MAKKKKKNAEPRLQKKKRVYACGYLSALFIQ